MSDLRRSARALTLPQPGLIGRAVLSGAMSAPSPISVQLYSLREEAAEGFRPVIARLGEIGFVGVELSGFHDLTPKEFAAAATGAGLKVSSAHIGDLSADAFKASLDDLQSVGCDTVALAFLPATEFESVDQIAAHTDQLNAAAEVAAARGVALGYHNHWWEFETTINGKRAWDHFIERLAPNVFIELDVYWATVGGADPVAVIAALGDRLRLLHVKDGPADHFKSPMVSVGSGTLDIASILAAAPKARWHIVELDRCATDMFDAIEQSHRFLVGNGLSAGR
jgi:sugar phosphate isomerase/epimerase